MKEADGLERPSYWRFLARTTKMLRQALIAGLGVLVPLAAGSVAAEVRPLEFIHALQEKGYHEIAVEYLNMLKQQPAVPPEVASVWDLEMSKSLRGSANRALNPKDFEESMNSAQKHLDKFLKENPNHAEAVNALVSAGMFSMDRALQHLRTARPMTDKAEKAKELAQARTLLDEARPRLKQAVDTLQKRLAQMPIPEVRRGVRIDRETRAALEQRARVEQSLLNARFQAALADYYTAQTYDDPKAEPRTSALQSAAKQLDDIYQANRITPQGQVNVIGLYAHMWHGKVADELGDSELAVDIYEEVLANEQGPRVVDKVLDPLFAQVQQFRFAIMARRNPARFLDEAAQWLKDYAQKDRKTEGYQGIALEAVKVRLEAAAQATGADKARLTAEATALLNDMVNVPSPYQQEAMTLRKKYSKVAAGNIRDAKTFEEAAAMAQSAGAADQWEEAVAAYTRSLEMAADAKLKDKKRLTELRDGLAYAKYMVVHNLFQEAKFEDCLTRAGKILQEDKETPAAPMVASLAVAAALNLYLMVPQNENDKRQAALDRLEKIAKMTEETWPGKAAADDARMALAQASLVRGKLEEAIQVFEKVNPRSERYPLALYLSGRTYWQRYLMQKMGGDPAKKDQVAADRAKAVERITNSLAGFRKAAEPNKPLTPQHVESQLLMALLHLEGKEAKQAADLLQPLVDQVKAAKPQALDDTTVRIFRVALQADLAIGDVAKASDVGVLLCDLGSDSQPVNGVLVEFARVLDEERKKADAEVTRATAASDAKATEKAKASLKSTQTVIGNLLKKLAARKELSLIGLVNVGDLCANVGLAAEAKQVYERVLAIPPPDAQADPQGAAQVKQAMTRSRAQLIGILRKAGNFDEAIKQARQLAEEHPRALEPQLELGRCLQSRAEQNPATYDEAIAQWTKVRNLLQPMRKKPPEYFEVIYNAAYCLYGKGWAAHQEFNQLSQAGDQSAAEKKKLAVESYTTAVQLLKSALVLNEKLSGPDMIAKYQALLDQLQKFLTELQGGAAPAAAPAATPTAQSQ